MPQNSHHPWYDMHLPQWMRCRDAMDGTDAVKGQGITYLPKPSGLTDAQYEAYKVRAQWLNASRRTRSGMRGLVFRRPPVVSAPAIVFAQLEDVTGMGTPHMAYAQQLFLERLTTGVIGTLVDLQGMEQPINALRATWTGYMAEQILSWQWGVDATGKKTLLRVVLREYVERQHSDDPYRIELVTQYRELVLRDGLYTVILWEAIEGAAGQFLAVETSTPTRAGQPLTFLPFVLFQDAMPPLLDLVDVNLDHYRVSADYKHELHWGSVITPVITGWSTKVPDEIALGSTEALIIPDADAKAFMWETSGKTIEAKRQTLEDDKAEMAMLGARLLETPRKAVEATETHQIRQAGEHSILQTYAQEISRHLTQVLRIHSWWINASQTLDDPSILYTLNEDYQPTGLTGAEMVDLMTAFQGGALSEADFFYKLKQGEALDPATDFETWQAQRQQTLGLGG